MLQDNNDTLRTPGHPIKPHDTLEPYNNKSIPGPHNTLEPHDTQYHMSDDTEEPHVTLEHFNNKDTPGASQLPGTSRHPRTAGQK